MNNDLPQALFLLALLIFGTLWRKKLIQWPSFKMEIKEPEPEPEPKPEPEPEKLPEYEVIGHVGKMPIRWYKGIHPWSD